MGKVIEMTGQKFGRLTVIRKAGQNGGKGQLFWLCLCECGTEKRVAGQKLRNGNTQSCGCFSKEDRVRRGIKHGHSANNNVSPTYATWASMIQRCTNPSYPGYRWWGGSGVTVCDRWTDFASFLADMGERPEGMTLDRIETGGHYEPGNCRWATHKEQQNNRRNNRLLTAFGRTQTLSQWVEERELNLVTVQRRLRRGMSHEQALYQGDYRENA